MNHIDFNYWRRRHEEDYPEDVRGKYPIFIDAYGKEQKEKSPYFETMSEVLRERGYFLKAEFVSICLWKTIRQQNAYEKNSEGKIKTCTQKAINASTDQDKINYRSFIEEIREIAKKNNQTPRQVEMALWKFDKEKGTKKE